MDEMKKLDWSVEEDVFMGNTPLDTRPFRNIIATLNPNACRRIVIASHYDSLFTKTNKFVGVIDSAVPCAMMINIAEALESHLKSHRKNVQYP